TDKVVARRALPVKGGPKADRVDEDLGDGFSSEMYRLDLGSILDLPWTDGTWLVTVLMRGFVSNRLRVRFEKSKNSYRDPEVEKFFASRLQQPRPSPIWPPQAVWPA